MEMPPLPGLLGPMQQIDPQRQGLLAAAFRGLQASGPSRMPVSLGQSIGQAGEAGMGAQRQAQHDMMAQSRMGMDQQMQAMAMEQRAAALKAAQAQKAQIQAYAQTLTPAQQTEFLADPQGFMKRQQPQVLGRSLVKPDGTVIGVDQTWQAEQEAARAQKMQELQMRLADQRATAEERRQAQREMAQMSIDARRDMAAQSNALRSDLAQQAAAQGGKPPAGYRFKPDGNMERIPGGPADIKAEADLQKKAAGAGDVDVALGTLRDAYNRLEQGGGITSTARNSLGNVLPAIASTGIGQTVGKAFGTNNQSARNDIAMARPALLAALMKATGMSAKQMDSNAELKLWLSTATDPTLDVESNRRALANIEKKYIAPQKSGASGEWAVVR